MTPFRRRTPFVLLAMLFASPVHAADWWVSPDGDDSASGTMDDPFATMAHADTMVAPGDVVHVMPGEYSATFDTYASGSEGAPIVWISETKWGARLIGEGDGWFARGDWVDIIGFEVTGDAAVGMLALGSHIRYLDNWVHHLAPSCDGSGGAGIDAGNYDADHVDMIGNIVHDVWADDVDGEPCNRVQGLYHAIAFGTIANNIAYNNSGWGIHTWHAPSDLVITNNLVFGNGGGGVIVGAGDSPGDGYADRFFVANNVVVYNELGIYEFGATGLENRYVNNLVFENPGGDVILQNGLVDEGTISADPLFVDWQADGSGDYHLSRDSPAIDAGTPENAPSTDLDGVPRPQGNGVDIGPYEVPVDDSNTGSDTGDSSAGTSSDGGEAGDRGSGDGTSGGDVDGGTAPVDGSGSSEASTDGAGDGEAGGCGCTVREERRALVVLVLAFAVRRRRRL